MFLKRASIVSAAGLTLCLLAAALPLRAAAQSTGCPPGFPEEPAVPVHLSQEAIASGELTFQEIFDAGQLLFEAQFNACDGQGRPATTGGGDQRVPDEPAFSRISGPDANSCFGCHNLPRTGGGGEIVANVFVLAQIADPIVTTENPEFSNFRNTLGMFGSGAIEMLAREMTAELLVIREEITLEAQESGAAITRPLVAKGISFGTLTAFPNGTFDLTNLEGIDPDLILKPFHQAGRVISLREFTNNALNHHHGIQSEERFDLNPLKGPDFDGDGIAHELTIGDVTALTIWQAALGVPGQVLPDDPAGQLQVQTGERLFSEIGCSSCHVPEMRLSSRMFVEPNPYNLAGNWNDPSQSYSFDMTSVGEGPFLEADGAGAIVRAYTDLKRHNLCDDEIYHYCNEYLSQGRFDQDGQPGAYFFLTRKLWDVGNSAPYGHIGDLSTITEAILMHGGEGRLSRDAFTALSAENQEAVVRFLKSLQVLPEGAERVITESELIALQDGSTARVDAAPAPPVEEAPPRAAADLRSSPLVFFPVAVLAALFIGVALGRRSAARQDG